MGIDGMDNLKPTGYGKTKIQINRGHSGKTLSQKSKTRKSSKNKSKK